MHRGRCSDHLVVSLMIEGLTGALTANSQTGVPPIHPETRWLNLFAIVEGHSSAHLSTATFQIVGLQAEDATDSGRPGPQ